MKIIPGEKDKIKEEIKKQENKKGRELTKKEAHKVAKKVHINKALVAILVGVFGIGTLGATVKSLPSGKDTKPETQKESTKNPNEPSKEQDEQENWSDKYKVQIQDQYDIVGNTERYIRTVKDDVESEVEKINSKEELLEYMKKEYIKVRQALFGDEGLTPENIKMWDARYLAYAYKDQATGTIITPGDVPAITEEKLKNDGINYGYTEENIPVYEITDNNEKVIDCITIENGENGRSVPVKVVPGNQYDEYNQYESALVYTENFMQAGMKLYENFGDENVNISELEKEFVSGVVMTRLNTPDKTEEIADEER